MKRKLLSLMLILIMSIFGLIFIITCTDANGSAGIGGSSSSGTNSSSSVTSSTSSTASSSSSAASSSSSVASSSSSAVSSSSSSVAAGLLDNFDDGNDSNLMGGINGEWGDLGGNHTYDTTNAYGGSGYALKAAYDVADPPGGKDTWFAPELGIGASFKNVSGYANLTFYIKKDSSTTKAYLKVCIKDNDGTPHESQLPVTNYITSITDTYQLVTVPLSAFSGVTLTNLLYVFFNINYADLTANSCPTTGIVYIDEIQFSGTASSSSASSTSSSASSSSTSAGPFVQLWNMDTLQFSADGGTCTVALQTSSPTPAEGTGYLKITPNGSGETKVVVVFDSTTASIWNVSTRNISFKIWVPSGMTPAIGTMKFMTHIGAGGYDNEAITPLPTLTADNWTTVTYKITNPLLLPSVSSGDTFFLVFATNLSGSYPFYIDDVRIQ